MNKKLGINIIIGVIIFVIVIAIGGVVCVGINHIYAANNFSFAKAYTLKNGAAFLMSMSSYEFGMQNLPSGYTNDDVRFREVGNAGLITPIENGNSIKPVNVGTGTIEAYIPGTSYTAKTQFQVVDDRNVNFKFAKDYVDIPFKIGSEYHFEMKNLPGGISNNDVTFSEKNKNGFIKISKDGNSVIGSKEGTGTLVATIKINDKKYTATAQFKVVKNDEDEEKEENNKSENKKNKLEFAKEYTVKNGTPFYMSVSTYEFVMESVPNGYKQEDVKFKEKNSVGLIEISEDGRSVIPKKAGSGTLIAYIGDSYKDEVKFDVVDDLNESDECYIKLKDNSKTVTFSGMKKIIQFTCEKKGLPKDAKLEWSSSNEKIATVDSSGKVIIKAAGDVTISVKYQNMSDSCNIIVKSKNLGIFNAEDNSEITGQEIDLYVGEEYNIYATENGKTLDNSQVEFTSTAGKNCSVDENGKITAIAAGTAKIKAKLKEKESCDGKIIINVIDKNAEIKKNATINFVEEGGKAKQYVGGNAFVVNNEWSVTTYVTGVENYEVKFSSKSGNYIENVYNEAEPGKYKLKAINVTDKMETLVATLYVDGVEIKSITTKFEIYSTMEEKESAGAKYKPYLELDFKESQIVLEESKTTTIGLNKILDTNIANTQFSLECKVIEGNEEWVTIKTSKSNIKITPKEMGTDKERKLVMKVTPVATDKATVQDKAAFTNVSDTIELVIMKNVVKVTKITLDQATTLKDTNITQVKGKSNSYNIPVNEECVFEFDISPTNATVNDYTLSVEDNENFIIDGKKVIALEAGKSTKLTATAKDSSNKNKSITINSILSAEQASKLDSISDVNEINISAGETVSYKYGSNVAITKPSSAIATVIVYDDFVTISGKKKGSTKLTVKENGKERKITINVNEAENKEAESDGTNIPVQKLAFLDKDYVNQFPLEVGGYYSFHVDVFPTNATNQDLIFTVSSNDFSVTSQGIRPNKEDAVATLTVTSVSNPNVSAQIQIGSIVKKIQSIRFAKDYVGDTNLDINRSSKYDFKPVITLNDGTTYHPEQQDLTNNIEYKKLLKRLEIKSDNENLITTQGLTAYPVKGASGSGTLTMYVKYDNNISTTAKYEANGINPNVGIRSVKFAQTSYRLPVNSVWGICPTIELTDGTKFKPSPNDPFNSTPEYRYYLSQLELVKIESDGSEGMSSTGSLLLLSQLEDRLNVHAKYVGTCKLGISQKGSNKILAETMITVTEEEQESTGVTGVIEEVDHGTTTTNKNLDITNIKFVESSYNLSETFGYHVNPIITLSDGTVLSNDSVDKEVYHYYCTLTDLYLTTSGKNSTIDFGVIEVQNRNMTSEQPKYMIPLKNGEVTLAIGVKSTNITYDKTKIKVNINK